MFLSVSSLIIDFLPRMFLTGVQSIWLWIEWGYSLTFGE